MVLKVLFKNESFIFVDKDCDLVINSCDPIRFSLQKQLLQVYPDDVSDKVKFGFYFPHRLDFATSGVMCIALSKKACATVSAAFQSKVSEKYYLAIVHGHIQKSALEINLAIGEEISEDRPSEVSEPPQRKMCCDEIKGRPATTRLVVLERGFYSSLCATKVMLRPLTGRRHQLRVHCCHIGHTIVGDYTYSNRQDDAPPRMFLHSYRLILPNEVGKLDVQTNDPFVEANIADWTVTESCCDINTGVAQLRHQLQDR